MKLVQIFLFCFVFSISNLGQLFAAAPDELLASYHFAGTADLAKNNRATKLTQIGALPETVKFRDDVLQKLARASVRFLQGDPANANQVKLIRPLLDDLLRAESTAEFRGKGKSNAELLLAVQLSGERSRIWETNLLQLGKTSKSQAVKISESSGWQLKNGNHFLKFFRADKWTVIVLGPEQSAAQSDFLKRLGKEARPAVALKENWLEADIDWPRLKTWIPMDKFPLKPARTQLRVSGKGEDLRTTVRAIYPEKIDWKSQPWQVPRELVCDPLISFAAGQKLAPFLNLPKDFQQLSFNPLTNQIYFWAQSQMPFQSYMAAPVKSSTNAMKTLGPQLLAAFNDDLKQRDGGELKIASNRIDVFWQGLPMIGPFLKPTKATNGAEFLIGGLFPVVPTTNLPPAELFAQISGRTDLVFYDWEITQHRLFQWMSLSRMLPIFPKELFVTKNAPVKKHLVAARLPEQKWLIAIAPLLGNTITEVTYKSPNEINVVRKSHIGLNSIELIFLSHWLEDPKFPSVTRHVGEGSANPFSKPPPKP